MQKIYFQTHGCSTNFSESEVMAGLLAEAGFKIVDKIEQSEIIVLNVCTVKGEFTALREMRHIKEGYPDKKLIIAGCLTPEIIKDLREISEDASLLNTHNINRIVEVVEEVINGNVIEAIYTQKIKKINLPRIRKNPVIGIIPILSGCNNNCSYCSVKLVKGRLESYPKESIMDEANKALREGCKELWITSQDNAAYGTEKIWRSSLPELLKEIIAIDKGFKIRVGMMNPMNIRPILDDLIEIYKSEKMFKFLHMPLQSGNNQVLEKMRRNYTVDDFTEILNRFRTKIPNLSFSTDVIVGFPGETEEQFRESMEFIRQLKPDVLNISRFIPRQGTEAAAMDSKLQENEIKERSRLMTSLFSNLSRLNNEKWLGWRGEILIDERGKLDSWIGRNFAYKQIIVNGNYRLGQSIRVKVTNTTVYDLRAEAV